LLDLLNEKLENVKSINGVEEVEKFHISISSNNTYGEDAESLNSDFCIPLFLGIDCGSTTLKSVLSDEYGRICWLKVFSVYLI
jgi:activator of 2-hydroxyglutaryl-CoA dehydratase